MFIGTLIKASSLVASAIWPDFSSLGDSAIWPVFEQAILVREQLFLAILYLMDIVKACPVVLLATLGSIKATLPKLTGRSECDIHQPLLLCHGALNIEPRL